MYHVTPDPPEAGSDLSRQRWGCCVDHGCCSSPSCGGHPAASPGRAGPLRAHRPLGAAPPRYNSPPHEEALLRTSASASSPGGASWASRRLHPHYRAPGRTAAGSGSARRAVQTGSSSSPDSPDSPSI
eukprot:6071638-Pyramimonas_sp.AAC.1